MSNPKTINDALSQLNWDNPNISAALQVLRDHWEEAFPILKKEIETDGKRSFNETERPPIYFITGVFLCSELKEQRVFPLLLEILNTPATQESISAVGFLSIHQMGRILKACATLEQLKECYHNESLSEFAINAMVCALTIKYSNEHWLLEDQKRWIAAELKEHFRENTEKPAFSALALIAARIMPDELQQISSSGTTSWPLDDKRREFLKFLLEEKNYIAELSDYDEPINAEEELLIIQQEILDEQWEDEWLAFEKILNAPDELLKIAEEIDDFRFISAEKIGPNERCPCGSGKKFKKCCTDSTVVRVPSSRISYQETLIASKDQIASNFMLAGYLYAEEYDDPLRQLACWIHCAEHIRPLLGNGTVTLKAIEHKRLFIGCTPMEEWIDDFCNLIYRLYMDDEAALSNADEPICWMLDKFSGLPSMLHSALLAARGIIRLREDQVSPAYRDLNQALSLNPNNLIARFNLIHTILQKGDPDAKQKVLAIAEEGRSTAPDPKTYDDFLEELKTQIHALDD